jgi:hypothetical protein
MVQAFILDKMLPALAASPGFLGLTAGSVERRMYTVTAWERPEDAARMASVPEHVEAVKSYHGPDGPAIRGWTSVWVPHHFGDYKVRCPSCSRIVDLEAGQEATPCPECGARLPERSSYW